MSTQAQSSSPFSRFSRLAFPFKSTQSTSTPLTADSQREDWYIPYNGPYEPPKERNTDSWGHLVSGWLMENDGQGERGTRARAMSNVSRPSGEDHVRKSSRVQASFIKLDQAGGVGDVPHPARPRRSQEVPVQHRASLASILSFGNKKQGHRLQHVSSTGTLRSEHPLPPVPHEALVRQESNSQPGFPRRHPYAYATPATPTTPPVSSPIASALSPLKNNSASGFSVQLLDPLARRPTAPSYLLPARRPTRLSLKASMSTPNLRAAAGAGVSLPKGKQRWFSAETWCDALILPRPRFAMRVDSEGSSGRIVSPPSSPIWPPGMDPSVEKASSGREKMLKKSQSAIQLGSRPSPPSPPEPPTPPRPPPPPKDEPRPQFAPSVRPQQPHQGTTHLQPERPIAQPQPEHANGNTNLRPFRPKSWALDDLAIPSPVPSLAKVLEDGRKLQEDRKAWQLEATKSFANKRARTVSRARSKSMGARGAAHAREPSAFDAIAEVTLLGSQRRRPTVHVRVRPPRSDGHTTSSGGGTNTMTGTGTGLGTFTSTHSQAHTRSRSHGHSNSLGSIAHSRSDDSFMWTPGHGRNHSLGKSALRIVRTTANTAAGLCGIAGSPNEDDKQGSKSMNEKAAAMEEALRSDKTKYLHFRDQVARDARTGRDGNVVMITPSSPIRSTSHAGPSGVNGVSPTPSGQSVSAEGVGIAISSPLPQDDPFEKEPIRIPAHPYAQGGGAYPYYQRAHGKALILPSARVVQAEGSASPTSTTSEDGVTKHRQPVKVHPYSPYSQVAHPFAAITGTDPGPSTRPKYKHGDMLSPKSSMFAELSPGTIREIMPDEIQYSPYISTPPIRVADLAPAYAPANASTHPYASSSNRMSEWGFADALTHTLHRSSPDSGLGTSEAHEIPAVPERLVLERPTFARVFEDSEDVVVLSPQEDVEENANKLSPQLGSSSGLDASRRRRLGVTQETTLAPSPMESGNLTPFRQDLHVAESSFHSSGSSPGVVSTQSSPPVSPGPVGSPDDLEQFRDLFYRPPENRTPSFEDGRPPISRQGSGSVPIDFGVRSTRSLSGLTTLARQLSVNMEEMQEDEHALEEADRVSPMWGTRHGGLAGHRPDDLGPDPPGVLSQSSSRSGSRRDDRQSPLRLPLDEDLMLSQPIRIVPEDVESSRASSMLELPIEDDDVRVREVEALPTPPANSEPMRFSTHLTQMDYPNGTALSPVSPEDSPEDERRRIVSTQSSLGVPLSSDPARSSFMTTTSGMSRLSDFPVPPSQITASHLSILNAYYRDSSHGRLAEEADPSRPGLVREASHATFGRQQMGEAL